jgi:hypothetical protein
MQLDLFENLPIGILSGQGSPPHGTAELFKHINISTTPTSMQF